MTTAPDDKCGSSLPLHEKRAWLALTSSVVVYGSYFTIIAQLPPSEQDTLYMLVLFAVATVSHGLIMAVGTALLTLRNRAEAKERPDERDRALSRGAATVAYFVLMAEMIVVGVVMPFNSSGWRITTAALLALVVSEIVRHAVTIANYRRGWHG
ncbi:hypothetical protein ASD76_08735 [Altererythrobacter sp. Root672]|nr:hypothetical protein ASD76_08735 [Altererythrobacter sp. Root672]